MSNKNVLSGSNFNFVLAASVFVSFLRISRLSDFEKRSREEIPVKREFLCYEGCGAGAGRRKEK